jgi:hypothetical protein
VAAVGPGQEAHLPVLDMIEAVVRVPYPHAGLPRLPRVVQGLGWSAQVVLRPCVFERGRVVLRRVRPASGQQLDAGLHPGVRPGMLRVFGTGGITPAAAAAALAAPLGGGARPLPGGQRPGLGLADVPAAPLAAGPAAAPGGPVAPRAPPPSPPLPAEEPMPQAAPAAQRPEGEPGFDVACDFVAEELDCSAAEAEQIVLAAREAQPAVYRDAAHASRPGDLPRAFRLALHAQAVVLLGEPRAAALEVAPLADSGEAVGAPGSSRLAAAPPPSSASPRPGPYRPPSSAKRGSVTTLAKGPAGTQGHLPSASGPRRSARLSAPAEAGAHSWLTIATRAAPERGRTSGHTHLHDSSTGCGSRSRSRPRR